MPESVARVAIDSPLPQLDRLFDYSIPDALRETAIPGVRVRVPLRSAGRVADGWLVELGAPGEFELSPLDAVVSPVPVLRPEVWTLARRAADRAAGAATDVLRIAIPGRQARVEKAWLAPRQRTLRLPAVSAGAIERVRGPRGRDLGRRATGGGRDPAGHRGRRSDGAAEWVGQWAVTHGSGRGGRDRSRRQRHPVRAGPPRSAPARARTGIDAPAGADRAPGCPPAEPGPVPRVPALPRIPSRW